MSMMRGVGDFVPASFPIPQNPLARALAGQMGDLVPGYFPVPQNPLKRTLGQCGINGCGCGNMNGHMICPGNEGMGDIGTSITSFMSQVASGGWQTWAAAGGALLLLVMMTGGGGRQRRAELASAKAQYLSKRAEITGRRPKRYESALARVV